MFAWLTLRLKWILHYKILRLIKHIDLELPTRYGEKEQLIDIANKLFIARHIATAREVTQHYYCYLEGFEAIKRRMESEYKQLSYAELQLILANLNICEDELLRQPLFNPKVIDPTVEITLRNAIDQQDSKTFALIKKLSSELLASQSRKGKVERDELWKLCLTTGDYIKLNPHQGIRNLEDLVLRLANTKRDFAVLAAQDAPL